MLVEYFDFIIKTVLFYLVLVIIIRLLGKREVGEISVFDLVIILLVADIATLAITDEWSLVIPAILSLFALLILQKVIAIISLKFPKFRKVIDYSPSIIIYDGKLNLNEMKKQSYTVEDLISQAREKGVMDLIEIKMAILESTGQLSIFKKDLYDKEFLPVVVSGMIKKENLPLLKLTEKEVVDYVNSLNMKLEEVFYVSSDGRKFYHLENL